MIKLMNYWIKNIRVKDIEYLKDGWFSLIVFYHSFHLSLLLSSMREAI